MSNVFIYHLSYIGVLSLLELNKEKEKEVTTVTDVGTNEKFATKNQGFLSLEDVSLSKWSRYVIRKQYH